MIKQIVKQVEKQPVTFALVAAAGVIAGVAIVSTRAGRGGRLATLADDAQHGLQRIGNRGAEVIDEGVEFAGDLQSSDKLRPDLAEAGRAIRSMGVEEKTVAVLLGTLLAKSATGFLRWRSEQRARHKAEALASPTGEDFDTQLEEQTVAELRSQASELEIEGRSAMNKDELVRALKDSRSGS